MADAIGRLLELGWQLPALFTGFLGLGALGLYQWLTARRAARSHGEAHRLLEQRFKAIEECSDGVALLGRGGRFVYVNEAAARLFGSSTSRELFGRNWRFIFDASEARRVEAEVLPLFRERGHWVGEVTAGRREGSSERRPLEISVSRMDGGGMTWIVRDGRWRETSIDAIRRKEERYFSWIQAVGGALALISREGRILEWNGEAERLYGPPREDALGAGFLELVIPEDRRASVKELLRAVAATGEAQSFESPLPGDGGSLLLWNVRAVGEGTGRDGTLIAIAHDATGFNRAKEALSHQEDLYRLLANNSSDLVALHNLDGKVLYASPSATTLLGIPPEQLIDRDPYQLSHSDDWKNIQASLAAANAGRQQRTSFRMCSASGEYVWFETLVRPIRDENGTVVRLQSTSRDISERKAFEDRLEHQALHEPLTGLPNRNLFLDRLNQALVRTRRSAATVAVMYMDLDRFKIVNDSMGHAVGDRLIAAVARRIRDCVREADTVARLGGDEFGVLLEFDISSDGVAHVAERVIEHLEPPFTFAGQEFFISASIGIAFSSPSIESGEDLLRYADVAMYRAKEDGPGNFRVFDPEVDSWATKRLEMETALRHALEREELSVFYQPLISLESGRIYGMEALVRWEHPVRGRVGPDEFIPLAEETGLIIPLGYWVMRRVCEDLQSWKTALDGREMLMSVNLSTRQFEEPDLEHSISGILAETGVSPARLQLEITESELMRSAARVGSLREIGVRVAIDDFGTGYSSLSYLKNMEADSLKIDKSFVNGLDENREDTAIVQTVITLAEALGLDVTAEGVETEEQLARLRQMGCHSGQGYYFARPGPAEEALDLLRRDPIW